MNTPPTLAIERCDQPFPWVVVVASGPCAGEPVGFGHRLRRDAQAWIGQHGHLPWDHVRTIEAAAEVDDLIVTIPAGSLRTNVRRLAQLEAELAAAQRVLVQVTGSAMMMADARKAVAAGS